MVIAIIAILIGVLLAVFMRATERARHRVIESSLRNAVTAAKSVVADQADHTQATPGYAHHANGRAHLRRGGDGTERTAHRLDRSGERDLQEGLVATATSLSARSPRSHSCPSFPV
jgi:type II secretory pathway pseudopilin PulG